MDEIKKKLQKVAESVEPIRMQYPLTEYRTWGAGEDKQPIAHIVFAHAVSAYARALAQVITPADLDDPDLAALCELKIEEGNAQKEAELIKRMWDFNSIFGRYHRQMEDFLTPEREVHHWSLRDITGTYQSILRIPKF